MSASLSGTIRREPSTPTLQAKDLNWLIGKYINWCGAQLENQATVQCYECKLRWFTNWWGEIGPTQDWMLHEEDFVLFERYLRSAVSERTKRQLSYHTRNDVLRRLREMFHWAHGKDHTSRDYAEWVPKADGGPPQRTAAGMSALSRLLTEAGHSPTGARDRAMVAMFIGMGLRRIEVHNLNVQDIVITHDFSGFAHVTGKKTKANPTGRRDAAFDAATGKILSEYLNLTAYTWGPLFRGHTDRRLTTQGIYRCIKVLIERAGLTNEIQACHDLRRAFTTNYARNHRGTDNADRLRRQLGHASYSQTSEYTLLDIHDIRRDFVSAVTFVVGDPSSE